MIKFFCMEKRRNLIFDFDGTLVDSFLLENKSMVYAINRSGNLSIDEKNIISFYGPTEKGIIKKLVTEDKFNQAWEDFLSFYSKEAINYKPSDDMIKLLNDLKDDGFPLYLITGRGKETLDISLKSGGIADLFIDEYTGSDFGINKDVSVLKLIKDHDVSKEDLIYIGDTVEDIKTMSKIDIDIISVGYYHDKKYQQKLRELNEGKVARNILELRKIIYLNL